MGFRVAIDGPSSAGKSTIAKKIAERKSFVYIDTGAMYRAMGYFFLNSGVDLKDEEVISKMVNDIKIEITYEEGIQQVILNGENITSVLRKEEVGSAGSIVSTYMKVREKLVELQQDLAKKESVVMDGRDIGTVVLKDAEVKIYLDASSHTRALRRHKELLEKGIDKTLEEVEKDLEERDYRDMNRKVSPLKKADDAIVIDTSNMPIDEVVEKILEIIDKKQGEM